MSWLSKKLGLSWRGVEKAVSKTVDEVGRLIDRVGTTVTSIIEDPKKLIATAIAIAYPGAGTAIGEALLGPTLAASVGATATQIIGQTVINTAANGGDVKSAVVAAALPAVGKEITSTLSTTLENSNITGTVNDIITRGAAQGATAAILGKDPLAAFVLGGTAAGVNAITSGIPDFDKLPKPAQNAIGSAIAAQVTGRNVSGAVTQSLVNDAINWAKTEVNKVPDAIKSAQAKYKADSGGTLTDEQLEKLLKENGADKLVSAVDNLYTTKAEASALWEKELGYKPSEFDLLQIEGLSTPDVKSVIDDKSSTTYDEAESFLKNLYGDRYTPTKDEITSLMGLKEIDAKKQAGQQYNTWVEDRNTVTNDELTNFLKKAGLKEEDLSESQLLSTLKSTEADAQTYLQRFADIKDTTFKKEGFSSQSDVEAAAKAAGYNAYTWQGKDYVISPDAEQKKIQDEKYRLVEGILKEQNTSIQKASNDQVKKAIDLVNAVPTGKLASGAATVQDVINGTYVVQDGGPFRVEVLGLPFYAENEKQKVVDMLPEGVRLASVHDVWGQDDRRKPGVELVTLADGSVAWVKPESGYDPEFVLKAFDVSKTPEDLAKTDPEAWLKLAKQAEDNLGKDAIGSYLANTANELMLAAYSTGNQNFGDAIKQTLSITTQGIGEQVSNLATFFTDRLGMDHNSAVSAAGKALQTWGAANQSASTKEQEKAITDAVQKADGVGEKIKAFATAAYANPGGFATLVAKEGVQEILPLWAAKTAYRLGSLAAYGANAALESMESWGAGVQDTYNQAKKMGYSDEEARVLGSKVGLQSAVITAVTSGIGDMPVINRITREAVQDSLTGITKAGVRSGLTEYFDEFGQNAAQQYQLTGKVNWDQAATAGTIGMGIGAGTTSGLMLGMNVDNNSIIGKDANGGNITFGEFMSGAKQADMSTVNMNAQIGKSQDGDALTLGSVTAMPISQGMSYDMVSAGLPSALTNTNVVVGVDELGNEVTLANLMGQVTEKQGFDTVYKNLLDVTPEKRSEAKYEYVSNLFKDLGYKPTEQEINNLISANPAVSKIDTGELGAYVDPRLVSEAEVRSAYEALGLKKPTQEDVLNLVGQYDQSLLAGKTEENINPARYNSIMAQLDEMSANASKEALAAIDVVRNDLNAQITALGGDVGKLGTDLNQRVDALVSEGLTRYEATQKAIAEINAQNQQLQGLIGTQAKPVTQTDINAVQNMLSGNQQVDLAYDVNGDKQITQDDLNFLNQIVSGQNTDWSAPAGSPWAATGLYGKIAEAEAARQADLRAAEAARQADIQAQIAREKEAARQSAIRTTAGQAQAQIQGLIGQLPGAIKSLQTTTTPIYAGEIKPFDFESPLDVGFLSPSKEKQTSQPGQQATKIASGGYLDDLLNLLR